MNQKINIDDLIKNIVKEDGLETPPHGFLNKVMGTVLMTNEKPISYKPLISKYVWVAIFSGVGLIMLFLYTSNFQASGNYPSYLDNILSGFKMFHFNLEIPSHISYIVTSTLIMLMIQVMLISTIYRRIHR